MIYDSHIHTEFSADSEMKIAEALAAAGTQGYGLVLTEHFRITLVTGYLSFRRKITGPLTRACGAGMMI